MNVNEVIEGKNNKNGRVTTTEGSEYTDYRKIKTLSTCIFREQEAYFIKFLGD
jgi:hypothetical protein